MLKRIAVFRDHTYDLTLLREEKETAYTDMIRITEFVDIEFPPLPPEAIASQVEKIDKEIAILEARNQKRIEILNRQKTEILSQVFAYDPRSSVQGVAS